MGNNHFSRRDFLKGAAAGAFGLATAGILGNLGKVSAEGIYTPGTYTATGTGFAGGTITVTLTVSDDAITNVSFSEDGTQTPAIGGAALEPLAQQAMSGSIDGVSGATMTSDGAKDAFAAALAQAMA